MPCGQRYERRYHLKKDMIILNFDASEDDSASQKLLSFVADEIFRFREELLTVCSCHATYAFQSESTLYICLMSRNVLLEADAKSEV